MSAGRAKGPARSAASPPPAVAAEPPAAPAPPLEPAGPLSGPLKLAIALTFVTLIAHALSYRFMTDDAYISFRYSRNLAHGHGLVFNPGFERVEGYSNFLWVLLLALFDRLGLAPERLANPLSLVATVALAAVVLRFTLRHRPPRGAEWMVLVPLGFLAVCRSFAVWSTSGLETRAFELLAIAGLLRLAEEVEASRDRRHSGAPWGSLLLGLAALTRPDGALVAFCALGAALGLVLFTRAPEAAPATPAPTPVARLRAWAAMAWPAPLLVAAQYAFRLAYYGVWAPNTYYAKVGGKLRPDAGLPYLGAFLLEYAAFLWIPALVVVVARARRSSGAIAMAIAAAGLLPHVAYVVAIGGDHFEYRPLDLLFPWIALLLYEGARAAAGTARGRGVAAALTLAVLAGTWFLPWRSHQDYPKSYFPGFPGLQVSPGPVPSPDAAAADHFLDPDRSWVTKLPLLRQWADAHRRALLRITAHFAGIRQEEHRLFFDVIHRQAADIRALIDRGLLPRDLHMAMDCVGVIPYLTDERVLDRLGLTDAHVAHQSFRYDLVAHGKVATFDYARERGVDLWFFHPAQLIVPAASSSGMRAFSGSPDVPAPVYVAPLDAKRWLMVQFPRGPEGLARVPKLRFWNMSDSVDARAARGAAIAAWRQRRIDLPRDTEAPDALGFLYAEQHDWREAAESYREAAALATGDPDPLINLAVCLESLGRPADAAAALEDALERARALGDAERGRAIAGELARLGAPAAR